MLNLIGYGHLYLAQNTINKKVYIGRTVHDIDICWQQHVKHALEDAKLTCSLHRAIRTHGHAKFEVYWLGSASSQEQLDQMEIAAIASYRSTDPRHGYNMVRTTGVRTRWLGSGLREGSADGDE